MEPSIESSQLTRGRGRGKSRGGLGRYLRARGRGRGRGRPAEFGKRLLLEGEEEEELDPDSEEAKELQQKFSKRQLASNADRYTEPKPMLNSDGMKIFLLFTVHCTIVFTLPRRGRSRARGGSITFSGKTTPV
jgi:hypothetical protein